MSMRPGAVTTRDGRARVHYWMLGDGELPLVYLPGGGGGLSRPASMGPQIAWWHARKPRDYCILYICRRDPLEPGVTFATLAEDVLTVLDHVGWGPTLLEAQSAGGPIAQHVAAQRPEQLLGLVLTSTIARLDVASRAQIMRWHAMLDDDIEGFIADINRAMWKPTTLALLRPFARLLSHTVHDIEARRMQIILEMLASLDQRDLVAQLDVDTLILGGSDDLVFAPELQCELAEILPRAKLKLYPGQGHGHDIENASTYERDVLRFALRHTRHMRADRQAS